MQHPLQHRPRRRQISLISQKLLINPNSRNRLYSGKEKYPTKAEQEKSPNLCGKIPRDHSQNTPRRQLLEINRCTSPCHRQVRLRKLMSRRYSAYNQHHIQRTDGDLDIELRRRQAWRGCVLRIGRLCR